LSKGKQLGELLKNEKIIL